MPASSIRRLGVMGGTFDPIHLGHLVAASEALHAFELDRMLFIPAGAPWQKDDYSPAEDRLMMVTLATADHPQMAVSRMEIDRRGPTYTAESLRALRNFHAGADLFFVGGVDALRQIESWHEFDSLAELAEFIVVARPGAELDALETGPGWPRLHPLQMPPIGISATEIRDRVRTQRPIDFLVPAPVVSYIRRQGLYLGQTES